MCVGIAVWADWLDPDDTVSLSSEEDGSGDGGILAWVVDDLDIFQGSRT